MAGYIGQWQQYSDPRYENGGMDYSTTARMSGLTGVSPEQIEDPNDDFRNAMTVATQGLRSGRVGQGAGGGLSEQGTTGQAIAGLATGGGYDPEAMKSGGTPAFTQFGAGAGANIPHITKTGAATLGSALQWVQGKKAASQEERAKALQEYFENLYDQDQAKQSTTMDNQQSRAVAIGAQGDMAQTNWLTELDRMNAADQLFAQARQAYNG